MITQLLLTKLRAVSLFSVVHRAKGETRVTDGARQERHEKRETTRKARENGLSRSSDFFGVSTEVLTARHVKRALGDGPLENLWWGGRSTKKKFAQGKIK